MSSDCHIVVCDDEADIRETFREYLALQGYRVSAADGGGALRRLLETEAIDLVILDLSMPGEDGLSLARFLRERYAAGLLMVTASGEVVDRIVGLEMGADDYLAKPVDLRELLARVKAILRRTRGRRAPAAVAGDTEVHFGACRLNMETRKLHDREGQEIPITAMEFELLKVFAERPNRVLTRDQLLDLAHNKEREPFDRSIDIRIARLRRKIEPDPGKPSVIRTVRGAGYLFALDAG